MDPPTPFSHLRADGAARMVDVSAKVPGLRTATAEAVVDVGPEIARRLAEVGGVHKGNVIETARIAGIMAAKRTAELIPMCHPLLTDAADVDCRLTDNAVIIRASVRCTGKTGVEMEAMTAVTVAALTVYDMCKSASKGIVIRGVRLLEKTGGKSGTWTAEPRAEQA